MKPTARGKLRGRLARAGADARKLTDRYGLAYLGVKNTLGPLTVGIVYLLMSLAARQSAGAGSALRGGADLVAGWALGPGGRHFDGTRLPSVGQTAGAVALASTVSSLLFPFVVMGAATLAPVFGRPAVSAERRGAAGS